MTNYLILIKLLTLISASGLGLRALIRMTFYREPTRMESVSWN